MGGVRSFFIESKLFQLVVEEGGRYFSLRIFERSRYFMKSVFMGKNVAQWLMKSLEQIVVGSSPKCFFSFREGDSAYTLQRSSNSFGLFLLLSELKVGGSRRSIIIPVGKAKIGWRVFGLELRKLLEPENYVNGGNGRSFLVTQSHKDNSRIQPFRSFADMVRGCEVQVRARLQSEKQNSASQQDILSKAPVSLPGPATQEGGVVGSQCRTGDLNFERTNQVGYKRRPPLIFKSKGSEHVFGNKRELGNSDWAGTSLTVEVNEKGKRRVVWNKGGLRNSILVIKDQRVHVPGGSQVQQLPLVGSDLAGSSLGLPVLFGPEPTGPLRLEVGESPTRGCPTLLRKDAHSPVMPKASYVTSETLDIARAEVVPAVGSSEPPVEAGKGRHEALSTAASLVSHLELSCGSAKASGKVGGPFSEKDKDLQVLYTKTISPQESPSPKTYPTPSCEPSLISLEFKNDD
ncbi:hypothetical protein SO802_029091 [Lithocarpus litseifolius]|uniref:Uncharacterized protein n=1 Tax=Lithocarpus litseifolius TaxID=425828 RepID=A0AAW2BUB5_9ROSI